MVSRKVDEAQAEQHRIAYQNFKAAKPSIQVAYNFVQISPATIFFIILLQKNHDNLRRF